MAFSIDNQSMNAAMRRAASRRNGRQSEAEDKQKKYNESYGGLIMAYDTWKSNPSNANLRTMMAKAQPIIDRAMQYHLGSSSEHLRARARIMAFEAIKSYDPKGGANLSGWIMSNLQGLKRFQADFNPIKTPERVRLDAQAIKAFQTEFEQETGQSPDLSKISEELGMSESRIQYVLKTDRKLVTTGQLEDASDENNEFSPAIPDNSWETTWAEWVYHDLDDTDKAIYNMRLGREPYTDKVYEVNDIAKKLGISPSAVSQRSGKIVDKLQEGMNVEAHWGTQLQQDSFNPNQGTLDAGTGFQTGDSTDSFGETQPDNVSFDGRFNATAKPLPWNSGRRGPSILGS
jgi:DNA-directed RNA polymerase specialized sigma subunit